MAVPIPETIQKSVEGILGKFSQYREVRWVSQNQLHVTLRFLGDTEESLVPKLEELLEEVKAAVEPFEAELGGIGAFPNLNHPRTLFAPFIQGEGGFKRWQEITSGCLEKIGIKPEPREYHPHLTLGRVREGKDGRQALQALRKSGSSQWGPWKADRFILFKSQLHSDGPVYTKLKEFRV